MPLLSLSLSQLLLAIVASSILYKLSYNCFFLKWLASHRFTCLLVPSDVELRKLTQTLPTKSKSSPAGSSKKQPRHKGSRSSDVNQQSSGNKSGSKDQVFKIPSNNLLNLKLQRAIITARDFEQIAYGVEIEWIIDLAIISIFSLILTELQFFFYSHNSDDYNCSILWPLLVMIFSFKTLWQPTTIYFRNQQSIGERSICICAGSFFLLGAMIILIADEKYLEFGLDNAYKSFNESATAFVQNHTLGSPQSSPRPTTKPISYLLVKLVIALLCSITGMLFTFPGLRFGQLHKLLVDHPDQHEPDNHPSRLWQVLYNINYLAPLLVVCLWIKPISRKIITGHIFLTLDDDTYDNYRIYCILLLSLFRFAMVPKYVGVYLASASNRLVQLRRRGGTVTNREVQLTVSGIYNYVNVVIIQYSLPVLMCAFSALMLMQTARPSREWPGRDTNITTSSLMGNDSSQATNYTDNLAINSTVAVQNDDQSPSLAMEAQNVTLHTNTTTLALQSWRYLSSYPIFINVAEIKRVFSADVFRGVFGFATWWLHLSWFCTSTAGLVYHNYFSR